MTVSDSGMTVTLKRLTLAMACATVLLAQNSNTFAQDSAALESTLVYPAEYFAEFNPVNVNGIIIRGTSGAPWCLQHRLWSMQTTAISPGLTTY